MKRLLGTTRVVADKSLTHRAYLLAALAEGESRIEGANDGEDCRATLRAIGRFGLEVTSDDACIRIDGGASRWRESEDVLDLGNSGTGMRLLAGVVASFPFLSILTGDASLRERPMARITAPLREMGARIEARNGDLAPLAIRGGDLRPIRHDSRVASAQVKSALLLAGLGLSGGEITIREPQKSRDHTERLLLWLGADIDATEREVTLRAASRLRPFEWRIPGDVSSAAFFVVAAALLAGSDLTIEDVGLNPTRTGALDVLLRMGADLTMSPSPQDGPEPVGTIRTRSSRLVATEVSAGEMPRLIDEAPILALAASQADGVTWFRGVSELRVKESDRLRSTCDLLRALGVSVIEERDAFAVSGPTRLRGASVDTVGDHRIAMTALVAGLAADGAVTPDSVAMIATSDPHFVERLEALTVVSG